ncbi:uncharacterized protein LOC109202349 [Tachysurus ichikawai]
MLSDLNLEEKKHHPPAFLELLLLILTEEDRQAAKVTRMKKHLGTHRQRAMTSSQNACVCSQHAAFQPESDPLTDLKQQVASLQSQLTTLISKKAKKTPKTKGSPQHQSACSNDPNPTLVNEKRDKLKEKRRLWEAKEHSPDDRDF